MRNLRSNHTNYVVHVFFKLFAVGPLVDSWLFSGGFGPPHAPEGVIRLFIGFHLLAGAS